MRVCLLVESFRLCQEIIQPMGEVNQGHPVQRERSGEPLNGPQVLYAEAFRRKQEEIRRRIEERRAEKQEEIRGRHEEAQAAKAAAKAAARDEHPAPREHVITWDRHISPQNGSGWNQAAGETSRAEARMAERRAEGDARRAALRAKYMAAYDVGGQHPNQP